MALRLVSLPSLCNPTSNHEYTILSRVGSYTSAGASVPGNGILLDSTVWLPCRYSISPRGAKPRAKTTLSEYCPKEHSFFLVVIQGSDIGML